MLPARCCETGGVTPIPDRDELLEGCEREPIHVPGAVQPHGCLFAFRHGVAVTVCADRAEALGRGPEEVFGAAGAAEIERAPARQPLTIRTADGAELDVTSHLVGDIRVVEVEPPSDVDLNTRYGLLEQMRALQAATTLAALLDATAGAVRSLTGFDRVMIYRFDPEWNGEVVAEAREPDLDPFLGLRYPASDIPPQARALYLRNPIRLIPAVDHEPVPLVAGAGAVGPALDLSDATLRAVSPVHLEYLRNMGVAASMSAALTVDGALWGLIACHHYRAPRRPSQRTRAGVEVLAKTASALLAQFQAAAAATERVDLLLRIEQIGSRLAESDADPLATLTDPGTTLAEVVAADGAATWRPGEVRTAGRCPPGEVIDALGRRLAERGADGLVTDHAGADEDRAAAGVADHAAGVLAVPVPEAAAWLLWFRDEQIRSVRWGGDPHHKELRRDPTGGVRLGPRRSFAEYVELVRGTSRPWTPAQVEVANLLGRRVGDGIERQLRRDRRLAEALQQAVLLAELPQVPGAELGVVYEPATRFGVGGDWYDVIFLPDGRAVLVLGDVAGHGFAVAATMSQLRHALRAYVVRSGDIGAALGELNELVRTLLPGEMATALVAAFDPARAGVELLNAGHLPPVIVRGAAAALVELPRHPALGVGRQVTFRPQAVGLDPDATLVLYTDELIERRGVDIDTRLGALVAAAAAIGADTEPQRVCELLRDALRDDARTDDATVFALRRTE